MTFTDEQRRAFLELRAKKTPVRRQLRELGIGYAAWKALAAFCAAEAAGGGPGADDGEKTRAGAAVTPDGALEVQSEKRAAAFPAAGTRVLVEVVRGRGLLNPKVVLGRVVGQPWPVTPVTVRVRNNAPYTPRDFRGQPFVFEAAVQGDGNLAEIAAPRGPGRPWPVKGGSHALG